jgi:hypothetical protein
MKPCSGDIGRLAFTQIRSTVIPAIPPPPVATSAVTPALLKKSAAASTSDVPTRPLSSFAEKKSASKLGGPGHRKGKIGQRGKEYSILFLPEKDFLEVMKLERIDA